MQLRTKQKIAQALKETSFARNINVRPAKKTFRFTAYKANDFLLGVIFDRSVRSNISWSSGEEINMMLGDSEDPSVLWRTLSSMEPRRLRGYLRYGNGGYAFHRHYKSFARQLPVAAKTILEEYDGDPRKIWNTQRDINLVMERLEDIMGIGPAISRMAVLLLCRDYGLLGGRKSKKYLTVKPDRHVTKVFLRTGLIDDSYTIEDIDKLVRQLSPSFPGALDYPAFMIGRTYCKATNPLCDECVISKICPKIL